MTAIAFRDGVMACDTQTIFNSFKRHKSKIIEKNGYLIGVSGIACPSDSDIISWFFKGEYPLPQFSNDEIKFSLLVLTPKNHIELWDQTGYKEEISSPFWATGAGADVCMGAMEMGASAQEAVKIAIKWCEGCGGRVISRSL